VQRVRPEYFAAERRLRSAAHDRQLLCREAERQSRGGDPTGFGVADE